MGPLGHSVCPLGWVQKGTTSALATDHTLVATLVLTTGALDLVGAHPVVAANARCTRVVACAAVVHVGSGILAPAVAHGQASRAHALALLALGRVVAARATRAAVVLVKEGVLQEIQTPAGTNR